MNTDSTADRLLRAADRAEAQERKYLARKRVNRIALALSLAAMAFGVFWLVWILWSTLQLGIGGITWAALSQMTPPPNEAGGLLNAMWGSFLMVMLATFVGPPVGIMAGIYLAESDPKGRPGNFRSYRALRGSLQLIS